MSYKKEIKWNTRTQNFMNMNVPYKLSYPFFLLP